MIGKAIAGAIILGAAFGFNAMDDVDRATPPRIQPVKQTTIDQPDLNGTIQYDPPGGYCDPSFEGGCGPEGNVAPVENPGDRFLCVEDPMSYDCFEQKKREWDQVLQDDGPVVLR